MMKLNYEGVLSFINEDDIKRYEHKAIESREKLINKEGLGSDFLGWVNWPSEITEEELDKIIKAGERIKKQSDYLVVVGIGGSYLGAKAAIDMLGGYFNTGMQVIFLGNTLSSDYTKEVLDFLKDKDFSVNVISKSGTTTEPAIAFRLLRDLLKEKYGNEAKDRIYVTTDKKSGALRKLTDMERYESFVLPADIGGRYSVLTAVGLLPMVVADIDILEVIKGAKKAEEYFLTQEFADNEAMQYAVIRNIFHQEHNKQIELLTSFEPNFRYFTEWWKQLFGESEGKSHKGLFPASVIYSTDLHSMGQYVQDGQRNMIETFITIKKPKYDININHDEADLDGLNYLTKHSLSEINNIASKATQIAHIDGQVPVMEIILDEVTPASFGYLSYFYMISCGISGYILEINPFDQEGVEAYKRNMFALLGKPGYEELKVELENNEKD